jgi:hypothetical protein
MCRMTQESHSLALALRAFQPGDADKDWNGIGGLELDLWSMRRAPSHLLTFCSKHLLGYKILQIRYNQTTYHYQHRS